MASRPGLQRPTKSQECSSHHRTARRFDISAAYLGTSHTWAGWLMYSYLTSNPASASDFFMASAGPSWRRNRPRKRTDPRASVLLRAGADVKAAFNSAPALKRTEAQG